MDENQTGNIAGEVQPLPRRTPWSTFAEHGAPSVVPTNPPPWITPRRRASLGSILATAVVTALLVGTCGAPAPAAPRASFPLPSPIAPADRVIEVRNTIEGWTKDVRAAESWLDKFTSSRMTVVNRCSGKAYRCITVKAGKLPGGLVGWSERGVVTIDTGKLARSDYRSSAHRKRLIAHEIAHTFGLKHTRGKGLMATTIDRMRLTLTASQRTYLEGR